MKINLRTKYIVGEVLGFTALWILITLIYFQIAILGFQTALSDSELWKVLSPIYGLDDLLLSGFIFGLIFSVINILFDRTRLRRLSLGSIIVIKSLMYILANSISDGVVLFLNLGFNPDLFSILTKNPARDSIPLSFILATASYYVFFIVLLNFLYQLSKRTGARILFNSILGKYHKPRGEKLVFLFLDLKNSTRIAESLEHKKYSMFIKDCFSFLTDAIYNCEAEVYQYVGDEAVLTWRPKKGIKNLNCLRLFFEYKKTLESKRKHFEEKYGHFPHFKAGIDFGEVTVTEVGEIRRDIAYHGDVLNTAARLEKLCKWVGEDVLITEYLFAELPETEEFECRYVDNFKLEGKDNFIKVYAVKER